MSFWNAVLGIGLVCGGLYCANQTLEYKRHGLHADGVVVARRNDIDSRSGYSKTAIVEFTPEGEREPLQFKTSTSAGLLGGYGKGEHVPVLYLAAMPDNARIDSFFENWFAPALFIVLGGLAFFGKLERSDDDNRWHFRWWD